MTMLNQLTKILANPQLLQFITQLEKIKDPEFKIGKFKADRKEWIGLLIREKEVKK